MMPAFDTHNAGIAGICRKKSGKYFLKSALAGTGRTEKAEYLTLGNCKIDIFNEWLAGIAEI